MRPFALPALPGLAAVAATVGLVDVAAALTPSPVSLVDRAAAEMGAKPFERPETAVLGLGALALGYGLARRRQLAWWCAALLLVALALAAVASHPGRLGLLGGLVAVLIRGRGGVPPPPG